MINENQQKHKTNIHLRRLESFLKTLIGAQVLNKLSSLYETKGS